MSHYQKKNQLPKKILITKCQRMITIIDVKLYDTVNRKNGGKMQGKMLSVKNRVEDSIME